MGVGQSTTIVCWLDRYSPTNGGNEGQLLSGWQINITQPDGSTVIIGPWTCSSAVSSDWKEFNPTQVGTYKVVFSWPGAIVQPSLVVPTNVVIGDIFLGATSEPNYLSVQQDPIPNYPETPLPTDYWTRPINSQNRAWSTLASNYLRGAWLPVPGFQNEGTGPSSAHILWAKPILATSLSSQGYPGGVADAQWPGLITNVNDYTYAWGTPIIMNGVIYQNMPATSSSSKYGYYATDLYTGQQLWFKNGTDNGLNNPYTIGAPGGSNYPYGEQFYMLTQGQLLHVNNANGNGIAPYLWMQGVMGTWTNAVATGTWYMLDPSTGNVILTLTNVPTGTPATDAQGDLLIYSYNAATGNFLCWNSTQAIYRAAPTGTGEQQWRPANGAVINAVNDTAWVNASTTWGTSLDPLVKTALMTPHSGYTMNYTDPSLKGLAATGGGQTPGTIKILSDDTREPKQIFGNGITTTYGSIGGSITSDSIRVWLATISKDGSNSPWPTLPAELNTNLGYKVTLNYDKNITVPLPGRNDTWAITCINYDARIFTLMDQQTTQIWCYNLDTAELLWGPTAKMSSMGYYSNGGGEGWPGNVYYGIYLGMYTYNYAGELRAYNVTNGNLLWSYNSTAAPYSYESAYGPNMPMLLEGVCDHMVYMCSSEHSPTNPLFRQSYIRCINITTGELIWKLPIFYGLYGWQGGGGVGLPIADGYTVAWSQYDNQVYCIGKGPSPTTVSAPQSGITQGNGFTITGTVTDQSSGAVAYTAKYGDSVAAVSDDSQEGYMGYLYMQQSKPSNTTGVPVTINAVDPNGNLITLGETTSDATGFYSFQVNPDMLTAGPGTYTVIAKFAGSNSYGSSSSESAFTLNAAAPTPTLQPATAAPPTDMYVLGIGTAIIITIIIGFAVTILILRKRP